MLLGLADIGAKRHCVHAEPGDTELNPKSDDIKNLAPAHYGNCRPGPARFRHNKGDAGQHEIALAQREFFKAASGALSARAAGAAR